jgi:cytochrome bd-type quinol oxidase subunit 2
MKRALSFILQFVVLLVAFFVGSILPVFHVLPTWRINTGPGSWFVLDGFVVLLVIYALLLLFAAARKRLVSGAIVSTAALFLAVIIGLASKFPFVSN